MRNIRKKIRKLINEAIMDNVDYMYFSPMLGSEILKMRDRMFKNLKNKPKVEHSNISDDKKIKLLNLLEKYNPNLTISELKKIIIKEIRNSK